MMSLKRVSEARISGNTYACREEIKGLGGKWDAGEKVWVIDIAGHPRNTMRGRSGLASDLRALERQGCRVEYA
jgi:hypothetical protein